MGVALATEAGTRHIRRQKSEVSRDSSLTSDLRLSGRETIAQLQDTAAGGRTPLDFHPPGNSSARELLLRAVRKDRGRNTFAGVSRGLTPQRRDEMSSGSQ